jgi:large subunit ribosomal protein L30
MARKKTEEVAAQEPVAQEATEQAAPKKTTKKKATQAAPVVKKLRVVLVKSPIGNPTRQKRTVKALGFNHVNQAIVHPDNASVRGMIFKVNHLVRVEEVEE